MAVVTGVPAAGQVGGAAAQRLGSRRASFREGLIIAGQQGLGVRKDPEIALTNGGDAVGLLLRILVPLLLAFAALALRNRVSSTHPWR